MTGPQVFVMVSLIIGAILQIAFAIGDDTRSSGSVAFQVIWELGYGTLFSFVLHWGGFW